MIYNYLLYKINFPNNKIYVGATINLKKRIDSHIHSRNSKIRRPIFGAMKAFYKNFTVEILETNLSADQTDYLEKYYIKYYNSNDINYGYNTSPGGLSGSIMSEDGKKRRSEKMEKYYKDPEYIKKITKHVIDLRDQDPVEYSKKMSDIVNNYFSFEDNKIKHSQVTTINNSSRQKRELMYKIKGGKPFYCVETGQVFTLLQDAADIFNVDKRSIHRVLKYPNRYKTILRKYTFKYVVQGENK